MIQINLKVTRDIERLNKSLGEGWTDSTSVVATDSAGELVFEYNYPRFVSQESVLTYLLEYLGFEVDVVEVLADD